MISLRLKVYSGPCNLEKRRPKEGLLGPWSVTHQVCCTMDHVYRCFLGWCKSAVTEASGHPAFHATAWLPVIPSQILLFFRVWLIIWAHCVMNFFVLICDHYVWPTLKWVALFHGHVWHHTGARSLGCGWCFVEYCCDFCTFVNIHTNHCEVDIGL